MNKLAYMISRAARIYSRDTAVVAGSRRLSFARINTHANQIARHLLESGIRKGDRVAVLLPNCPEYIETDFALIKTGAVRLPLNPRLSASECIYMVGNAEARVIVFAPEFLEIVQKIRSEVGTVEKFVCVGGPGGGFSSSYEQILSEQSESEVCVDVEDGDPYQILYTSGTTGRPKGAVTSFGSRLATLSTVLIEEMRVERGDVFLTVAPMAHGGGTKIFPHFIRGAVNVVLPKFSAETLCRTIQDEKVTTTWMVPTMITMLLEYPDLRKFDLGSLKTVVYAASPIPYATLTRALEVFGNIFVQVYGLSEAPNPDLLLPKSDHNLGGSEAENKRLKSAGREVYGVRVRVVDDNGKDVLPGEIGEIIISGDNLMTGYWKMPEATSEAIRDGWFYTGDMATVDEENYVYIVDRRKDMIISGGFNVYPREVEEVIYRHPAVLEASVVGVPDERWGESLKAVVVCRPGRQVTEEELIAFCKPSLAGYKKPHSVDFVSELPKNPFGKILRREIKRKYWEGCERMVN
jgi:acyl-CoA synthetase (AMP-forming)/AMP-acid ligase II